MDASAILDLWEENRGRDGISRSVALSAYADPTVAEVEALAMPIGQRNERLLALRKSWTDADIEATAECPSCGTALEFSVNPVQLLTSNRPRDVHPLQVEDRIIHWRPVTSRDLLLAATESDDLEAARMIVRSCVEEVLEDGMTLPAHEPTAKERTALGEAIELCDPLCDLRFNLECAECGEPVAADLQIHDVVWKELESAAKQLVYEVHTLATAYGWTEADSLGLSPSRRATYLESAGAT